MPRKSIASLSVVQASGLDSIQRLAPPEDMIPQEAQLWSDVVDAKPADWFQPDTVPLLTEYCRAKVMCDRLRLQIEVAIAEGEVPKDLMKLRDMEAKRLMSIATKLRLTQQSRYTPGSAGTASKKGQAPRPWQS